MADNDDTPSNLFHLAAGNPAITATSSEPWNAAFAAWAMADALSRADLEFGPSYDAENTHEMNTALIQEKFGPNYRSNAEGNALYLASWEDLRKSEEVRSERYLTELWAAEIALATVPAPTLAALLFKIELIKRGELHNWNDAHMKRAPFDLVAEDVARLREVA